MRSNDFGEVTGPYLRQDLDFAFQALLDQRPEVAPGDKNRVSVSKAIVQAGDPRQKEYESMKKNEQETEATVEAEKMEVAYEWQMVNEVELPDDVEDPELWTGNPTVVIVHHNAI
jgi:hypothetical protein